MKKARIGLAVVVAGLSLAGLRGAFADTVYIVSFTGGGLYRYRLNDCVEILGFVNECPLLRFVGRKDKVVDLFGEKLNELEKDSQSLLLLDKDGIIEPLAQRGTKAGLDNDFLRILPDGLELPDMRVQVRVGNDPIKIVIRVWIGTLGQAQFLPPAAHE